MTLNTRLGRLERRLPPEEPPDPPRPFLEYRTASHEEIPPWAAEIATRHAVAAGRPGGMVFLTLATEDGRYFCRVGGDRFEITSAGLVPDPGELFTIKFDSPLAVDDEVITEETSDDA